MQHKAWPVFFTHEGMRSLPHYLCLQESSSSIFSKLLLANIFLCSLTKAPKNLQQVRSSILGENSARKLRSIGIVKIEMTVRKNGLREEKEEKQRETLLLVKMYVIYTTVVLQMSLSLVHYQCTFFLHYQIIFIKFGAPLVYLLFTSLGNFYMIQQLMHFYFFLKI